MMFRSGTNHLSQRATAKRLVSSSQIKSDFLKRFVSSIFCSLQIVLFVTGSVNAQEQACNIAKDALKQASAIRGLSKRREIPCFLHNQEQIKEYLLATLAEELPPQRLAQEELLFKVLGILPPDYDYEKGIIDLYLSQLGGYYDPKLKRFVMASWLPAEMQTVVAVHELTHALQDQHFNLRDFLDNKKFTSDQLLARLALVEGDATAVMHDYTRQQAGQPALRSISAVNDLLLANVVGASILAGSYNIPLGLQLLLVFPYTSGLRFTHQKLVKGGYSQLDQVFKNPPRSTEEILHPEKYEKARPDFLVFTDQDVLTTFSKAEVEIFYGDTLGEFLISVVLSSCLEDRSEAALAARGWGGDRIVLAKQDRADQSANLALWKINWDSEDDAKRFTEALLSGWQRRYKIRGELSFSSEWQELTPFKQILMVIEGTAVKVGIKFNPVRFK